MPVKLSTTVNKISLIGNSTNVALIQDFYEYLKNTGASEKHINNNLKAIMNFAKHIDPNATFFDIKRTEQIIKFLDTKIKTIEEVFVEVGMEISNISVKPPPFDNEQKQKLARLASKYGVEIKP